MRQLIIIGWGDDLTNSQLNHQGEILVKLHYNEKNNSGLTRLRL